MSTAKHKGKGPQSLTANELREGLSVWMTADYEWSHNFKDALQTEDETVMEKMQAKGEADENDNLVVGVYFIDIEADTKQPVRYREKFRVSGPTYNPEQKFKNVNS